MGRDVTRSLEGFEPVLQGRGAGADVCAKRLWIDPELEQLLALLQGEPELLGHLTTRPAYRWPIQPETRPSSDRDHGSRDGSCRAVGPPDEAGVVAGARDVAEALRKIVEADKPWVSRADGSVRIGAKRRSGPRRLFPLEQ